MPKNQFVEIKFLMKIIIYLESTLFEWEYKCRQNTKKKVQNEINY